MSLTSTAIIVINDNTSENVKNALKRQLSINLEVSGLDFDANVALDSNYITNLRHAYRRILVVRDISVAFDKSIVDFVLLLKNGLAFVEKNKNGPPGFTVSIDRIYLDKLIYAK